MYLVLSVKGVVHLSLIELRDESELLLYRETQSSVTHGLKGPESLTTLPTTTSLLLVIPSSPKNLH